MRVVYFTAGTTGAGHVVRGLALGRALERRGFRGAYTRLGPRLTGAASASTFGHEGDAREVAIDHEELLDPARASSSELARTLDTLAPDLIVVDMFWAPLVRLLPRAACEAWLLVRRAPAAWLVGHPRMPFDPRAYARVVAIEPGAPAREAIDPIVIANPDEVLPPRALRERLGVGDGARLEVIAHAGVPGEWRALVDPSKAEPLHVFTLDSLAPADVPARAHVHDGATFFPLARWLAGADAITCGAGYNAFWEARWLGNATRTRFVAFERPIDDQRARLAIAHERAPRANGADTLAAWITRV